MALQVESIRRGPAAKQNARRGSLTNHLHHLWELSSRYVVDATTVPVLLESAEASLELYLSEDPDRYLPMVCVMLLLLERSTISDDEEDVLRAVSLGREAISICPSQETNRAKLHMAVVEALFKLGDVEPDANFQ